MERETLRNPVISIEGLRAGGRKGDGVGAHRPDPTK